MSVSLRRVDEVSTEELPGLPMRIEYPGDGGLIAECKLCGLRSKTYYSSAINTWSAKHLRSAHARELGWTGFIREGHGADTGASADDS